MAPQSHAPRILLTRPVMQSQRFARDLRCAVPFALRITIAPLMMSVLQPDAVPTGQVAALIFTSETAVRAYAAQPARIATLAYCVGDRTAKAARALGMHVMSADGDAEALIALITAQRPPGAASGGLLHLRGRESRGDVAPRLTAAGLLTGTAIIYDQLACPMTPAALRLLQGKNPVIVPLFSPRSARLFTQAANAKAPLRLVAMSRAVADAVGDGFAAQMAIATEPTAAAVIAIIKDWLTAP
jgi:uroporphyrinogen-III synthase